MIVKTMTLKNGRVLKVTDDGNGKVVRDATTDEYITRVWKHKSRWMHAVHNGRYNSMTAAVAGGVTCVEMHKALHTGGY